VRLRDALGQRRVSDEFTVPLIVGVLVFTGLTAYDTQNIKDHFAEEFDSESNSKLAVWGALSLYLNFINLFQLLLNLTGDREE
jgi:FtsH-binding integral membrane protein